MTTKDIYLIKHEKGPIKIGISNTPGERVEELSCSTPYELGLIHTIKTQAPKRHERTLHRHYQDFNIKNEWFDLPQTELATLFKITDLKKMPSPNLRVKLKNGYV